MARTGRPRKPPSQEQGHRARNGLAVVAAPDGANIIVPEPSVAPKAERLCVRALRQWDAF